MARDPIQGGASVVRHHRAGLVAELDAIEQRAARLAQRLAALGTRADLLRAAITADSALLADVDTIAKARTKAKKVAADANAIASTKGAKR